MKYFNLYTLLLVFLLGFTVSSFSQDEDKSRSLSDKPTTITKYIVDETGTLTQEQINSLLKKLENFDKQSSTQVVVYMISSLNGESIEDVSYRIAEKNKIGKKGKDNGVLVFIAKNDRMLRIEVGYGLEGVLTDAYTTQIRTKEMNPSFKAGNFFEGINKGVDAIIAVSKGEYKADKKKNNDGPGLMCLGFPVFIIIIFVFIFFSIFMSVLRRIFGWGGRHYTGGSGWGGGGFFGGGGSSWG
ncbi:MAG: TPM domain-containing protein, partial [Ignavibacteriota bacterium]